VKVFEVYKDKEYRLTLSANGMYTLEEFENGKWYANRCYLDATLNRFNQAVRAASRLNERAQERYQDGLITGDEYIKITRLTEEILYGELPARIRSGLVKECSCKIRD